MASLHGVTIVGLGDPVMDILVQVTHGQLSAMGISEPGGCVPIDAEQMQELLDLANASGLQGDPRRWVLGWHAPPGGVQYHEAVDVMPTCPSCSPQGFQQC